MRGLLIAVMLAMCFFAPVKRLDVAELEPVETVAVRMKGNSVVVTTDTDNEGVGPDVPQAIADLERTTPGVVYLDTAQYLLITEDATRHIDILRQYLKPSVKVCEWDGQGSVEQAALYLRVMPDLPALKNYTQNDK